MDEKRLCPECHTLMNPVSAKKFECVNPRCSVRYFVKGFYIDELCRMRAALSRRCAICEERELQKQGEATNA